MMKIFVSKEYKDGSVDLKTECGVCGKPITHSNEYGDFCEDECGIEDDKKAYEGLNSFVNLFANMMATGEIRDEDKHDENLNKLKDALLGK